MNQKILIITIVAVVVVITVIGLWLAGTAGSGPLAGCTDCVVAPQSTTLTMNVWMNKEYMSTGPEREIVFQGTLTAGNYPVSGRTVTISTEGSTVATVTTVSGRFEASYIETGGSQPYIATFAGDDQYLPSQSTTVSSGLQLPLDRNRSYPVAYNRSITIRDSVIGAAIVDYYGTVV
jgi:hypothetical protein